MIRWHFLPRATHDAGALLGKDRPAAAMIRFLNIRHFAIVDQLEIEFEPGFNVLTGETGAGKSIVVGALGLLVGGRGGGDLVRTGEDKAVIQASFETEDQREIVIRREISSQGRSRIFIDGSLAATAALKGLGQQLVDLHGQHEHQALFDPRNHLALLDVYGRFGTLSARVGAAFEHWHVAQGRLKQARLGGQEKRERIELLTFQLGEIDGVQPEVGEDGRLAIERQRLANAEHLRTLSSGAYATLYERDDAVLAVLGGVWRQLDELASLDPLFEPYLKGGEGVRSQLEDLADALRSYAADAEASPDRLTQVEARLAELEQLKKKYGQTLDSVLDRRARIVSELDTCLGGTAHVAGLEKAERSAREEYLTVARELSVRRRKQAETLARRLRKALADLAIPRGQFEVRFEADGEELPKDRWTARGIDSVEFYFSANPGEALRALARVASGGELSRVMLGLKTLASTDALGKTLVFDEVDAGIGAAVADRIGEKLRSLAQDFQVLCVTHQPQIAAYATTHHRVSKWVERGRTAMRVERLTKEGRIDELARLMTGSTSERARATAQELAAKADEQKSKDESERAKAKG